MKLTRLITLFLLLFSFVACETGEFDDDWGGSSSSSSSGSSGGSSDGGSAWTLYKRNCPCFTVIYRNGTYYGTEKQSRDIYTAQGKYWIKYSGSYYSASKNSYSSMTGCPVSLSGYDYFCFASANLFEYNWFFNL